MRVWNISDHPKKGRAKAINMFGAVVAPGKSVEVNETRRAAAMKLAEGGDVHVGDRLPEDYVAAKGANRAELPKERVFAHGSAAEAPKTPAPKEPSVPAPAPEIDNPKPYGRRLRGK
jgi:hypothetical protein